MSAWNLALTSAFTIFTEIHVPFYSKNNAPTVRVRSIYILSQISTNKKNYGYNTYGLVDRKTILDFQLGQRHVRTASYVLLDNSKKKKNAFPGRWTTEYFIMLTMTFLKRFSVSILDMTATPFNSPAWMKPTFSCFSHNLWTFLNLYLLRETKSSCLYHLDSLETKICCDLSKVSRKSKHSNCIPGIPATCLFSNHATRQIFSKLRLDLLIDVVTQSMVFIKDRPLIPYHL